MTHRDGYGESSERVPSRWGKGWGWQVWLGISKEPVARVEGGKVRGVGRAESPCGLQRGVWLYFEGDACPWRDSLAESLWAGILEMLRSKGTVPGNTAPKTGWGLTDPP